MAKQAIEGSRRSIFMIDPETPVLIGRDTDDGPEHPRYDVRVHNEFDEAIVQGMLEYGVKKPINVTKNGDRLEVVDGRQRVINAREANRRLAEMGAPLLRIPVLPPERGTDAKLFGLTVLLNEHAVQDSAFGRGQKAQTMLDMGYSEEEVATHFRVSVSTIKNYTSLLDLVPEIQTMIVAGSMPATKGYELAQKDKKAQKAYLHRLKNGNRSGQHKRRAPSKKVLRKVVDHGRGQLNKEFLLGVRYALGLVGAEEIEGLKAILDGKAPESEPELAEVVDIKAKQPKAEEPAARIEKRVINGKEYEVKVLPAQEADDDGLTGKVHVAGYGHQFTPV